MIAEEPGEVRLLWPGQPQSQRVWLTMRTPGHDFELAAGYLVAEGFAEPGDITQVAYCTEVDLTEQERFNVVTVALRRPPRRVLPNSVQIGAGSACGVCGAESVAEVVGRLAERTLPPTPEVPVTVALGLPNQMRERQVFFSATGGVHAAALATSTGELLVVREDVGRHNAVDKVVGERALCATPEFGEILLVSGRAGYELVAKAITVGVSNLISVGAPTSLSVSLAQQAGLRLYCFTSAHRTVQYS